MCSDLNTLFYFDIFIITIFADVCVLAQYYFICECLMQHNSYSRKKFLLNAFLHSQIFFGHAIQKSLRHSNVFFLTTFILCDLFLLIMFIVYLYNFIQLNILGMISYHTPYIQQYILGTITNHTLCVRLNFYTQVFHFAHNCLNMSQYFRLV